MFGRIFLKSKWNKRKNKLSICVYQKVPKIESFFTENKVDFLITIRYNKNVQRHNKIPQKFKEKLL